MKAPVNARQRSPLGQVVALVQARMGSSRLPGKMLMDLCGHPLLHWVLARTKRSRRLDSVVLATSACERDDALEDLAERLGIHCYRGSEDDVLGRLAQAARAYRADTVVRLCGDNPLIAPEEIDRLVDFYQAALDDGAPRDRLYASNATPALGSDYPDGLGGEILSDALLDHLDEIADTPRLREHVTAGLLEAPKNFDLRAVPAPPEIAYPDVKLDVDTRGDLERLRRLCQGLCLHSRAVEIVQAYRAIHEHDEGRPLPCGN